MLDGNCTFMIDYATRFFNYLKVAGWFHSSFDQLADVRIDGTDAIGTAMLVNQPHQGVASALGPNKGFYLEVLLNGKQTDVDLSIQFTTKGGQKINAKISDLCAERKAGFEGRHLIHKFLEMVREIPQAKLLDVGGRARSGLDRSKMFEGAQCTVLDVLPGDNVDVVGDAHAMSTFLKPNSFDAVFSLSVFEHLLMPWIVAAEISRILKPGGIAFISSHQTLGIHDQPWDFWRFSNDAWDGLFNRLTGFQVLGKAMEDPQFIVPHFHRPERGNNLEGAVGYVGSCVLARKTGEPSAEWNPLRVSTLIETSYPGS